MPELPEVETVRAAMDSQLRDAAITKAEVSGQKMRWPIPDELASHIRGRMIARVRRRGKYLLVDFTESGKSGKMTMLMHLGMSGSIRIYDQKTKPPPRPHDHLRIECQRHDERIGLALNDPRRFGGVKLITGGGEDEEPLLRSLGIDAVNSALDGERLHRLLKTRKAAIKTALLDQKIIAGIGNIYAAEILFEARIAPQRKANRISLAEAHRLVAAIHNVLQRAIKAGGTTLRDYRQSDGAIGYFAQELKVYGRDGQPCTECAKAIRKTREGARSTYYCQNCQKRANTRS